MLLTKMSSKALLSEVRIKTANKCDTEVDRIDENNNNNNKCKVQREVSQHTSANVFTREWLHLIGVDRQSWNGSVPGVVSRGGDILGSRLESRGSGIRRDRCRGGELASLVMMVVGVVGVVGVGMARHGLAFVMYVLADTPNFLQICIQVL